MAFRHKPDAQTQAREPQGDKPSSKASASRASSTREAVQAIVRRYRETFERLGR